MAEAARSLNNEYISNSGQWEAELLRYQKHTEANQQANSQVINSQLSSNNINERIMSRQNNDNNNSMSTDSSEQDQDNQNDAAETMKQAQQIAKLAANPTIAGAATMVAEQATDAIKKGEGGKMITKELLKQSWLHLIDSFGATLIYLNIHPWVGFIEGNKVFCKLGEETKSPAMFKKAMGMLEAIGIFALDFILFMIILVLIALIVLIADAIAHPIKNFGILWELFGISF